MNENGTGNYTAVGTVVQRARILKDRCDRQAEQIAYLERSQADLQKRNKAFVAALDSAREAIRFAMSAILWSPLDHFVPDERIGDRVRSVRLSKSEMLDRLLVAVDAADEFK